MLSFCFPFFNISIYNVLVIKIAVNMEQTIPILRVIANPFIGPEPILASTSAAIRVVTFASSIVTNALLYPAFTEEIISFPPLSSSLILSKIITFASIAIPIVSIKPAIPGSVRVAPNTARKDRMKTTFNNRATFAIIPENL